MHQKGTQGGKPFRYVDICRLLKSFIRKELNRGRDIEEIEELLEITVSTAIFKAQREDKQNAINRKTEKEEN